MMLQRVQEVSKEAEDSEEDENLTGIGWQEPGKMEEVMDELAMTVVEQKSPVKIGKLELFPWVKDKIREVQVCVALPPLCFVGPIDQRHGCTKMATKWDPQCSLAVVTALGMPTEEALALAGMDPRGVVIALKMDEEHPLVTALEAS